MLSGETSVGRYPIKSVRTMAQIIEAVEAGPAGVPPLNHVPRTQRGVLSFAARDIGERLSARALVAFSVSPATRSAGSPACTRGCRCWRSRRSRRCAASSR